MDFVHELGADESAEKGGDLNSGETGRLGR